jgi:iron(III) transport system substrate-binding protein
MIRITIIKHEVKTMSHSLRIGVALSLALAWQGAIASEVNLYTGRQEALIKPLLDQFTAETGIKVNLVTGRDDGLIQRLRSEGVNSPADILLTTDIARLQRASEANLFQPMKSKSLEASVPASYRHPQMEWVGLSLRARMVVYAKDRVKPSELGDYNSLTDEKWRGRLCVRSSDNVYNQSMTAAYIAHYGEAAAEKWARGLVANFARPPAGGDRDQIQAVAAGSCDIALVNTYYLGIMLSNKDPAQREMATKVAVHWPDMKGNGVHVNISGAGITRSARNRENAIKLLEFLASPKAQAWYAETNHEYPIREGVATSSLLQSWGTFKADKLAIERLGALNATSVRVMDRAGWR